MIIHPGTASAFIFNGADPNKKTMTSSLFANPYKGTAHKGIVGIAGTARQGNKKEEKNKKIKAATDAPHELGPKAEGTRDETWTVSSEAWTVYEPPDCGSGLKSDSDSDPDSNWTIVSPEGLQTQEDAAAPAAGLN